MFVCPAEQIWLEQGIERGLKKGLSQGQQKALSSAAVKMLKEKLPLKVISKITGFTLEEIQKLKSKKH